MQNKTLIESIVVIMALGTIWYGTTQTSPMEIIDKKLPRKITVKLDQQNNSGETGTALLMDLEGKTRVVLQLNGYPIDTSQPAHIHTGTCADLGEVKYPLIFPMNGSSETTLDTPLNSLLIELPLAVNIHKSAHEAGIYYACGNITQ